MPKLVNLQLKDGTNLQIRSAIPDDASRIISYVNQISGESDNLTFGKNEFQKTIEAEKEFIKSVNSSINQIFIIGEIKNEIISVANISANNKMRLAHFGTLGISVAKKYWHIGVGKAMMQFLINWALKSKVITKINLSVRADNTIAIKLYEKMGFRQEGFITRGMKIRGDYVNLIEMGIEL